jgi:6-phosphofructokinase 2
MKIVTLTLNPALDKSTTTNRMVPEQKLRCGLLRTDAGGGGINVSKGIHKLGGESVAIFPAGGPNGDLLQKLLRDTGIQTAVIQTTAETRENFSVTEEVSNYQYRFTMSGEPLSIEEAHRCLELVKQHAPKYWVVSGSLPPGIPDTFMEEIADMAEAIEARLILDTSGNALQIGAKKGVYLLKPNLGELSALCGVSTLEMNQVDDAALDIIHKGMCEVVVVSLGPQGALLATRDGFEHIPAPMVKRQTTVGAGDSMVAGMTFGLSQKQSFREIAQLGVACGSAATMNRGTELFHPKDVQKLLNWIKEYGERYRFTDF